MDLLGSILNAMDKPPAVGSQERILKKKQKEDQEKRATREKEELAKYRQKVEDTINKFQTSDHHKHKFDPANKVLRSVILDVADIAGLTAFSFGEEEVDRHVVVFKKEFAPSDDELLAYRRGEEWSPEKAKEMARLKELRRQEELEDHKDNEGQANSERKEKKRGKETAKDAQKIITPNRQFGFVSSENKRDQRSIEQTLADIRAKKKQKVIDESNPVPPDT